jgi:NAD(P)H-flavin reductase
MFVNFTNHPSQYWSDRQLDAARKYGDIYDISFPDVNSRATYGQVRKYARKYTEQIVKFSPRAVLCQGEFTLVFAVVELLKSRGITVLAACTKRIVTENMENGVTKKSTEFKFISFRKF